MRNTTPSRLARLYLAAAVCAFATPAAAACGEVVTLAAHGTSKLPYSLALPAASAPGKGIALVLLPGGGGHVDLDAQGCARNLKGNSLVRSRDLFHGHGFATALVDAPSDHRGGDGLGGFRLSAQHAAGLGKVIADVRRRTSLPVWLVGTSRGTISAVNAAVRLAGGEAPDGLVLTSPVTSGRAGGQKAWVVQTVFGVRLEDIKMPVLVVAHAADACIRTPPGLAPGILARTGAAREQSVRVTGGPRGSARREASVDACGGSSPHGFIGQEADVAAGIARFVRGGTY